MKFVANQRSSKDLGRSRLVAVSPQPIRVPEKTPTLDSVYVCESCERAGERVTDPEELERDS